MEKLDLSLDSNTKRIIKFLLYIFCAILLITFIFLYFSGPSEKKQILLSTERHTTVIEVYANKNQHNFVYARFSNGVNDLLYYPYKVGDSISKNKGDSIEYIFRKGKIIEHNYLKEARKNGEIR
jgi:hypothetical protein